MMASFRLIRIRRKWSVPARPPTLLSLSTAIVLALILLASSCTSDAPEATATAGSTPGTSLDQPTATPLQPTVTPLPPTATPVPPTVAPMPPTATPLLPTVTTVLPTATPVPPTIKSAPPTTTPAPPTVTPVLPTATPVPPIATPLPPTVTPVPPTATPVPPTATSIPPTVTPVPPTPSPVPPTATPPPPTATPAPALGERGNPIPFGFAAEVRFSETDHWEITVLATQPDGTSTVLEENQFNDPPEDGNQFYLITVRAKYLGPGSATFDTGFRLKALGDGGVVYTTFENSCGVIPNEFPSYTELFTNGQLEGVACWQISSADADSLILIVESDFASFDDQRVWFSLDMTTESPTPLPTATPVPPTPTSTQESALGERGNPIPFGVATEVRFSESDHWEITVLATQPDGTTAVLEENQFNDPPEDGNQFYLITVRARYLGTGSATFDAGFRLKALGDGSVVYTTFENSCGVIPDEFPSYTELFAYGQLEGVACWQIASADADSLILIVESDFASFDDERVWFSLDMTTESPTPFPTATPVPPTPTSTQESALGDRGNPIPFGLATEVRFSESDHWEITVLATQPDGTTAVLEENQFNDPPEDGNQFYLITVRARYLGTGSATFDLGFRLKALGDVSVVYTTFENSCGVIPDEFPSYTELFTNGQLEGVACWQVASADADSLILIVESDFASFDDERVWFSLR